MARRLGKRALGAAISVLIIGAGVGGCGNSDSATESARVDRQLDRCVDAWNETAGEEARTIVGGLASSADVAGRMFVFSDGACGLTVAGVPELAGLSTYAKRGGRFEPYINTRGQGFGQRPDPNLLTNSQQFEQAAEQAPNVDVLPDGTVEPMRDARIAKTEVASALAVQDLTDGSITGDQPYILDAAQWDALSPDEKIEAVAAYAADGGTCPISEVERIAEAIRDGEFMVVDDSVEATLGAWCAGETPSESGGPGGGNSSSSAGEKSCAPYGYNDDGSCKTPSDIDPSDPEDCPTTGPMPTELGRLCFPE